MQIERVKKLHQELQKHHKNYKPYIEELSEYILYGDRQSEDIFDYFAEKNILAIFYDKLKQANQDLTIFIIERMSLIMQKQNSINSTNLTNPLNLNYVLSNPILHDFINHKYDFNHPEIVDYYVNFLKTIAIRINRDNFYLYFNQRYCSFPLLWQAQKFISYPDNLVKNTIQNIILSLTKLAADPEQNKYSQSIIIQQNLIMQQFKNYLTCSPFIEVYIKYLIEILKNLRDIKTQEQLDLVEDYLYFFNDLIVSCQFLSGVLEKIIIDFIIQPILENIYLNKKNFINLSYEICLYTIYLFLTKLPLYDVILSYFFEDKIYKNDFQINNPLNYGQWQYCPQNREKEFQFLFSKNENEIQIRKQNFLQKKDLNQIPNQYKQIFLLTFRSKDSTILYIHLQILFVAKQKNYSIPVNYIIPMLQNLDEVIYPKHLIELIILLLINEDIEEIKQIYQQLTKKIQDIVKISKQQQKKLTEGLLANWHLIEQFNCEEFQNQKPNLTLKNLLPYNDDPKLGEFKLVYLWYLMKHLLGQSVKKEIKQFKIDQEISHLIDGEFIQIPNSQKYIIIEKEQGYLIYSEPTQNPNFGKIKFIQHLKAIDCSFDKDYLLLECNRLSIEKFETLRVNFFADSIKDVINIIYNSQCQISEQILIKLEQLLT